MHGLLKIWFIGDKFSNSTFNHLRDISVGDAESYAYKNFEVRPFFSSKYSSSHVGEGVISRICNNLVRALNKHNMLPKAIIFVLDDDICKTLTDVDNFSVTIGTMISWLLRDVHKLLSSYKDWLPCKSKVTNYPHIIWIAPPTHKYFDREDNSRHEKFARSLSSMVNLYDEMSFL